MSTYYKYAQFTDCSPLSAAASNLSFELQWELPDTNIYKYKKLEIYRYIGELNVPVTIPPTETDTYSKLIYTATQEFTIDQEYINNVIIVNDKFNGNIETTTFTGRLTGITNFTDDLSIYNNANIILRTNHNISEEVEDAIIVDDILKTKRCIYYIMVTNINGAYDSVPYCVGSHTSTGILDNTSTKTQVRHDMLHFEGDLIWSTALTDGAASGATSRTSVDLNSMFLNINQQTPTGRGGYAWVSSRTNTGIIYKCNLNNGLQTGKYVNNHHKLYGISGHGICVDPNTGDCYSGSFSNTFPNKLIRCKDTITGSDESTTGITQAVCDLPQSGGQGAYGLSNIPGNPNILAVAGQVNAGTVINNTTGSILATVGSNYGLSVGPDGTVFYTDAWSNTTRICKSDYTTGTKATALRNFCSTVDNYTLWPNISTNQYRYHTIGNGTTEPGFTSSNGFIEDLVINGSLSASTLVVASSTFQVYGTGLPAGYVKGVNYFPHLRGIGSDGENNLWAMSTYRTKVYRVKNNNEYPFGGNCRYPSITLYEQPLSYTNTREIEWFLTRDSGYQNATLGVTARGPMDQTAQSAWWDLVEDKRFELAPTTNNTTAGFSVKRESNGTVSPYTKNYGIRMKNYETNFTGCLTAIENWYTTYGGNTNNLSGRRLMPWYGTTDSIILSAYKANGVGGGVIDSTYYNTSLSDQRIANATNVVKFTNVYKPNWYEEPTDLQPSYTIVFPNWNGFSYEYSDFTGNILLGSVEFSPINKDTIHPQPNDPSMGTTDPSGTFRFDLSGVHYNDGFIEIYPQCYPWTITTSGNNTISGYDNLTMEGNLTVYTGSYDINTVWLYSDDYDEKSYILNNDGSNIYPVYHIYKDPTKIGLYYLPSGHNNDTEYIKNLKESGMFTPHAYISALDIYSNLVVTATANGTSMVVLERWPEPKTYLEASDLPALRSSMFSNSTWGQDRFDKSSEIRKESNSTEPKRKDITYGVDPVHVIFKDCSIARTYPLSSWYLTLSTDNPRIDWYPTKTMMISTTSGLFVEADTQNFYDTITAFDFRYGNYRITTNVAASTTSTSSDKEFINYIKVSEFEPFANFWATSAFTVDPTYSYDNPTPSVKITEPIPNGNNNLYPFVSGYAPLLTVYFQDSSEAHTFPISEYVWNFGDYYNEGSSNVKEVSSNYYTISSDDIIITTGDFNTPNWKTNKTGHIAEHTYTIPGTYDVTLTIKASTTNTTDICARYITNDNTKRFYVYVEEIPPVYISGITASISSTTGFSDTTKLSGASPQTYYFCGSGIQAGSFPICKMVWDFGDGTIETINRTPSSIFTTQGLPITYNTDPRYTIVPHTYINNTTNFGSYNIGVSAYACNTNTMTTTGLSGIIGPITNPYVEQDEKRRLIGTRFDSDGNLIYIFEGLSTKNTYSCIMSGVI